MLHTLCARKNEYTPLNPPFSAMAIPPFTVLIDDETAQMTASAWLGVCLFQSL
jgi:hypothetical protein